MYKILNIFHLLSQIPVMFVKPAQHSVISTVLINEKPFDSIYMNKYTIVCIRLITIIDFILILLTPNKTTILCFIYLL